MSRLVSANDLCVAMQHVLEEHLWPLAQQLGYADREKPLVEPVTWTQLPTRDALTSATFPAGAIDTPGVTGTPVRKGRGGMDATWRIAAGLFDRGESHDDTAARIRDWAALIRACVSLHPTLGGVAQSTVWAGESYAEIPQRAAARTLGGCAVAFDVTATNVVDVDDVDDVGGLITSTHTTTSARLPTRSP